MVIKFRNAGRKDIESSPIRVSEFVFCFFSPDGLIFRAWSVEEEVKEEEEEEEEEKFRECSMSFGLSSQERALGYTRQQQQQQSS